MLNIIIKQDTKKRLYTPSSKPTFWGQTGFQEGPFSSQNRYGIE